MYEPATQHSQEKLLSLYKFIGELSQLKSKIVKDFKDYPWICAVDAIPLDEDGNVKLFSDNPASVGANEEVYRDSIDGAAVLLRVHQPDFEPCPKPAKILEKWLLDGWDHFAEEAVHLEKKQGTDEIDNRNREVEGDSDEVVEYFTDNERRVLAFEQWSSKRNAWAARQKIISQTREFFTELYKCHKELELAPETLELVIATGFFQTIEDSAINHPVLMRRVQTTFDAKNNILSIENTDSGTELYSQVFQNLKDIDTRALAELQDSLTRHDCHPLKNIETSDALKIFVNRLSPHGLFAPDGEPSNWSNNYQLCITLNPTFILRKRDDGTAQAVERIIKDIEDTGRIPPHFLDLIGDGVNLSDSSVPINATFEDKLAEVGGEDTDILLAKEANREQLEIARRIEKSNAVLVQGPPGTGKTHTITNLIGHFLAQGKSVLVTSYSRKALTVLKEQLVPEMQPLCVSMIERSNRDMTKSVDGITNYMSHHTSYALANELEQLRIERQKIFDELVDTRHTLFQARNQECENIVIAGKGISPSRAAAFVLEHSQEASIIPGTVDAHSPLPLSSVELTELYRTNGELLPAEEYELSSNLPGPDTLLQPADFTRKCAKRLELNTALAALTKKTGWEITVGPELNTVNFKTAFGEFNATGLSTEKLDALSQHIKESTSLLDQTGLWSLRAISDGKLGGVYRSQWETLIRQINDAASYSELIAGELYGKEITISANAPQTNSELVNLVTGLRQLFLQKGTLSWFESGVNQDWRVAQSMIMINGTPLRTVSDCDIILHQLERLKRLERCKNSWNRLMCAGALQNVPLFEKLSDSPHRTAQKWIPFIQNALDWDKKVYRPLCQMLNDLGIDPNIIFRTNFRDTDDVAVRRTLNVLSRVLPFVIEACNIVSELSCINQDMQDSLSQWSEHSSSVVSKAIRKALLNFDSEIYESAFENFSALYEKNSVLKRRRELLSKLASAAPEWADAIQRREGIHGASTLPAGVTFDDVWACKQYTVALEKITALSIDELQQKSSALSKLYRQITAEYATKSAWYQLLLRTDRDSSMKKSLHSWKILVKKIGKGTGRRAPELREQARKLMAECQRAVPAWIMPISRALETLDPSQNRFDVVIVDEASQSDLTAMTVLYMGEKLIIVGDDQQVSPMAIGIADEQIAYLQAVHIKNKIPSWYLYDAKTSLYDIAMTTFQPLMLKEHFRCVPEIIEYSNRLSYDGNIKPLRDARSSNLLPAVVNYRVENGRQNDKTKINVMEARAIVALIKSCMEQPEYADKTFGVISMLGSDQSKKIQTLLLQHIDIKELEARHILCGIPPDFQGDERNVIFLSMVYSGNENGGPLALRSSEGIYGEGTKKRYNVAASRARDQLWVVHSLDAANDLKPDDIRRGLLEYASNPEASMGIQNQIEAKSESPFELRVAKALVERGYNVTQQWPVGHYRLDMVVSCGTRRIAIECDGERYHSTPEQIYNDMERQTILERQGWRFIRIRGSEYFRDPESTIQRVTEKLQDYGINPERADTTAGDAGTDRMTPLLRRVLSRAAEILQEFSDAK